MSGAKGSFLKAIGLGMVSYIALTIGGSERVVAQSALPAIEIQAPHRRAARPARRAVIARPSQTVRPIAAPRSPAAPAAPVVENARGPVRGIVATRSATGTKTDTPLLETPQSISVVTRDQIEQQAATRVSESLGYTAGVRVGGSGLQSARFDGFTVRGFDAQGSGASLGNYLDGLRWYYGSRQATQIDPWVLERVEVLKGPASILYGGGSPSGLLNLVSKRPSATPGGEIFTRFGSYGYLEGGFDVTGPVANDPRFLYRVIGLGRMSDSQIDFQKEQRLLIAPSFTFAPTSDTKLTVSATYQRDPKTLEAAFLPAQGTVLPNPNGQLPINRFHGDPAWGPSFDRTQQSIGYQFEHRFADIFTFRSNFRYGNLKVDFHSVDNNGLQANNRLLNRTVNRFVTDTDSYSFDNHLQAKFATGPLKHTALFGVDYGRMDMPWQLSQPLGAGSISPLDLYAPAYYQNFVAPRLLYNRNDELRQLGIYAQDQIELGNFRVMLSGRQDFTQTATRTLYTPTNTYTANIASDDKAFTYRAGLLYLFENGFAPYASYATSFEPQAAANLSGVPFVPTTGQQSEVGFKYAPPGWNALLTVSAFDLTKQNVTTPDPANTANTIQTGEIRSRGIEVEGKARLTEALDLIATYTYTDVEITKSNVVTTLLDGSRVGSQGKVPTGIPRHMASIWANYQFKTGSLAGLGFGAGVRYIGETYATDYNVWNLAGFVRTPSLVPDSTVVDAAVNYDFGYANPAWNGFSAGVNARNLFDRHYVAGCASNSTCFYGVARTVLATLRYRW